MLRRTILSAFGAGNGALEITARRIPQRSFSCTAQRNATQITHFTPTSDPALDQTLAIIRQRIILPAYLTLEQRKKLYSKKWAKQLQSDPITIEIDGEVTKFRHLDVFAGDMPNTRKIIWDALKQFKTDADFRNLRPLLEGVQVSGRKLDDDFYAKVVRHVGSQGRVGEVLEAARGARRSGLRLDSSEKVNEMLHWIQLKAADAGWTRPETEQALRWAEMVVELLEDAEHRNTKAVDGDIPLNRDPQVLMAPLHLAAALVVKCGVEDEAVRDKVHKLASTIVRVWPEGKGIRKLHPIQTYLREEQLGYLLSPNKLVSMTAPLLHGLKLAAEAVRDPALAEQLRSRYLTLDGEVQAGRREAADNGKGSRGEVVYNRFFGEQA